MRRERLRGPTGQSPGRIVRVSASVPGRSPADLLKRAPGLARGSWQGGNELVAHAGCVAQISLEGGSDRFARVREEADRILADAIVHANGSVPSPPRWFGGFSFHERHGAIGSWSSFPAAHFVLPAYELAQGPSGATLTVNVRARGTRRAAIASAEGELARALDALDADAAPAMTDAPLPALVDETSRITWDASVDEALARIDKGELRKVVLARALDIELTGPPDPVVTLGNVAGDNPGSFVFLFEPAPGSVLVGAAPERIGLLRGSVLHSSAVAGSAPRGSDAAEDDALASALSGSPKDRSEHRIVVESMVRRLSRLADHVEVGSQAHLLRLSRIQHLETDLYARLPADVHALDVIAALHPTPAVGGSPTDAATRFLRMAEPFERGWYAGPVGWFDANGDGEFVPALRSAVLQEDRWRLFAGAGIVEGSVSEREWDETRLKFEPMLRAIGLGVAP